MGYYTRYTLNVVIPKGFLLYGQEPTQHQIISELIHDEQYEAKWALESDGSTRDNTKWYDHDDDMLSFSKRYPEFVFVLTGEGEEPGDLWMAYYKDGKKQTAKARIVYEPFDPTQLK